MEVKNDKSVKEKKGVTTNESKNTIVHLKHGGERAEVGIEELEAEQ